MAAPNIVNVATITGKTNVIKSLTTTATNLIANAGSSGKVFKVNSIIASNTATSDSDVTLTVDLFRSSVAYKIINDITIASGSAFTPIEKNLVLYLEEGDTIRCTAGTGDSGLIDVIGSFEEIS
jgi:hypothetical protein